MDFLLENWFNVVQTIAIVTTLLVTLVTLLRQGNQLKVANSFLVTQHHREIWNLIFTSASLSRVFEQDVDLETEPITEREKMFVNMIFLHMSASLKAVQAGAIYPIDGMEADIQDILSHPIPYMVWQDVKTYHDKGLLDFVAKHAQDEKLKELSGLISLKKLQF